MKTAITKCALNGSSMKITIAIMGHPKRINQINALEQQLVFMPFWNVNCIIDTKNSEWHTGKRALQVGVGQGDWHVVIQDDAILTPNFYENLENAILALSQKALISLYVGTSRPLPDRVKTAVSNAPDGTFLQAVQLFWGVGIAIPSDHIEPVLDFVEDIELQYDNKIGEFYCQNGLPVYYTMPSLVDHDDDLGTLIDGHGKHINSERRVAHRLATGLVSWTNKSFYI